MTTPAWLTLAVGVLGFTGVLTTQLLSNRREDLRWRREREREQQVWAREDAARSYEYRREAYAKFFAEYHSMWGAAVEWEHRGGYQGDPPEDTLTPLYMTLAEIKIYGTAAAYKLADEAFNSLVRYVFQGVQLPTTALDEFQAQVRRDLLVPDNISPLLTSPAPTSTAPTSPDTTLDGRTPPD